MINRVLIRTKVVQMLYSYLLTQNEFRIQSAPGPEASRDQKYGYRLYCDLLLMILKLSGAKLRGDSDSCNIPANRYFSSSSILSILTANNDIKAIIAKAAQGDRPFDSCLPRLYNDIIASAAYRSYTRTRQRDIPVDVTFWVTVLKTIIAPDQDLIECARKDSGFTIAGFELGIKMTVETLEGYSDSKRMFSDAVKSLEASLNKARDLYHALLWLPVELTRLQEGKLDNNRNKYLPSEEDLNPSLKFVDNLFVKALENCPQFDEYFKERPFSWSGDPVLLRSLLEKITAGEIYAGYMGNGKPNTMEEDAELWRQIFKTVILPSDELAETLESKSVYWNDDLEIIGTFVVKTIRKAANAADGRITLLPKYKDDEDARFGADLFVSAIKHRDEYRAYIEKFIDEQKWDHDRLALMDIVIMTTAITELIDYPAIPVAVTLNEYIEIANSYSTPRSGQFINGILYSIIKFLKEQHLLLKE